MQRVVFTALLSTSWLICTERRSAQWNSQGPTDGATRPADLLVKGAAVRPLAIDITIWSRLGAGMDPLDLVIERKMQRGRLACSRAGWRLLVWAADTFGAIHPSARPLVNKLIRLLKARFPWKDAKIVAAEVWSALSAAVVARAADQLCRHSESLVRFPVDEEEQDDVEDSADECSNTEGELRGTQAMGESGHDLEPDESWDGDADEVSSRGPHALGNVLVQPGCDLLEQNAPVDTSLASPAPNAMLPATQDEDAPEPCQLCVKLPSGAPLPCTPDLSKTAGELKAAVLVHCGHPASALDAFGLALGYEVLADGASLRAGDVRAGDTLTLFARSPQQPG